jgi:hypothetical protein
MQAIRGQKMMEKKIETELRDQRRIEELSISCKKTMQSLLIDFSGRRTLVRYDRPAECKLSIVTVTPGKLRPWIQGLCAYIWAYAQCVAQLQSNF